MAPDRRFDMDNRDMSKASKPRRPLPTPASSPKPSSPVASVTTVTPTNFYATHQNPPPLPTRPRNIGSSHTTYLAPPTPPPNYGTLETTSFREPELITEEPISADDPVPELIPQDQEAWYTQWSDTTPWDSSAQTASWESKEWDNDADSGSKWPSTFETSDYWTSSDTSEAITIDGRDGEEEKRWWDPAVRDKCNRPGFGILPPILAERLHNSEHSLFSISVTPPDLKPPEITSLPPRESSLDGHTPASASIPHRLYSPPPPPPPPPTPDDVRTAVPHPNAYYCTKENGWVLLLWKSSSVFPPLAKSFRNTMHQHFPDQSRRKRTGSCIGEGEQPFGQVNKTHHFHVYTKAVNAHNLNPPFFRSDWEKAAKVKQLRRTRTIHMEDFDAQKLQTLASDRMEEDQPEEEEGDLLDLYVCCQCSFYCVASTLIPGVIPRRTLDEFIRDKREHPPVGKTKEVALYSGLETVLKIIENKLWKGESRTIPVCGKAFQTKMGWNPIVRQLFEALGFQEKTPPVSSNYDEAKIALQPPSTDIVSYQGKQNRAKLLRAWVELSAWMTDYQRRYAAHLKMHNAHSHKIWVKVDSARDMYQGAIGAHPDQIPRSVLSDTVLSYTPLREAWHNLGLTANTYSWELLAFGYMAQCRCDPANTVIHFSNFYKIVKTMQDLGHTPPELQAIVMEERGRFRYTLEDQENAIRTLGFGKDGHLGVEFESDVPEEFIADAWRDCVRRAWRDTEHGLTLQRDATEAFRIVAEIRGSAKLWRLWETGKGKTMNPDRAYDTLEIPKEVDDAMLLTVYMMRVEEQPNQTEKMREALFVIAEIRSSARLRQFLETGQDPGEITIPIRPDLPRGLNQLGNTCYLNSLLQYFYTIKELRQAVAPMISVDFKPLDDDKLTDDELKRHRVGGRLVTRREIARSKKFISQLADLFWQLEYCEAAAVTPTIDLAKLALVTSRDEEEEEADKGGTDSSNDTDATLVDDAPSRFSALEQPPKSPARSPSSVLGKRPRDLERQRSEMDIDTPTTEGFVMVPSPRQSNSPQLSGEASTSNSCEMAISGDADEDVEMRGSPSQTEEHAIQKPPNLPPRKPTEVSDSVMMFGKQHDVAECMDNCMFQIETALLKFDGMSGSQDDKTSVVKRLFYGKIRQRLTMASDHDRSKYSIHEKEDLFSHLPVNVAADGVDLYDGLSGYFDDVVDFQGKKARMEVSLVDLPPVLQIQLQRVQFNRETLQPYKSQAYVKFAETLYMDRFLDTADPQKRVHSKAVQARLNDCQERIFSLTQGRHAPFTLALSNTLDFLSKQNMIALPEVEDILLHGLTSEQELLKIELDEVRDRATKLKEEVEDIWKDDVEAAYELTSVFIHRGTSPSWGHYFFYSRHLPDHPDSWFKYNDSDVTVVTKDEVLANTTGSTANPYLLVFARKGLEVVDTVKRFDPKNLEIPS